MFATTPTTLRYFGPFFGATPAIFRPIASRGSLSGQSIRASASLITITPGAPALSDVAMSRPAMNGRRIVAKYPLRAKRGFACGDLSSMGRPSASTDDCIDEPERGTTEVNAAEE